MAIPRNLRPISEAICATVKARPEGACGALMFLAVAHVCTQAQFDAIMDHLVHAGWVALEGNGKWYPGPNYEVWP